MNTLDKIAESNRIEGIIRPPSTLEIQAFDLFLNIERVSTKDLVTFVGIYQPNARLRDKAGLDVRVGGYVPPRGGPHVAEQLKSLLDDANTNKFTPWEIHVQYETLHPFTDCNGRSGRMLWYWMMASHPFESLGFLHAFYYQTLSRESSKKLI